MSYVLIHFTVSADTILVRIVNGVGCLNQVRAMIGASNGIREPFNAGGTSGDDDGGVYSLLYSSTSVSDDIL